MNIDIDSVLETLKDGKTAKTKASLNKLAQYPPGLLRFGGQGLFSITTIGRVSEGNGGVGSIDSCHRE